MSRGTLTMKMELNRTCFTVIAGFHDFVSSSMDRQMVPDG
jgi:hypothetical protein